MLTRRLVPLAALVPLLLAPGCTASLEVPRENGEEKPGGEVPVAPPPRAKKTTAELLVGTWRFVKRTPPLIAGYQSTVEYTKDGHFVLRINNPHPRAKPRIEPGTYRVEGDTLFRVVVGPANSLERNVTIDYIDNNKLVTSCSPPDARPGEREVTEYERAKGD